MPPGLGGEAAKDDEDSDQDQDQNSRRYDSPDDKDDGKGGKNVMDILNEDNNQRKGGYNLASTSQSEVNQASWQQ